MSKADKKGAKRLAAMRRDSRDWRIPGLETAALAAGVRVRKPDDSHVVFEHPAMIEALSLPSRRWIKPIYVQRLIRFIDKVNDIHE